MYHLNDTFVVSFLRMQRQRVLETPLAAHCNTITLFTFPHTLACDKHTKMSSQG